MENRRVFLNRLDLPGFVTVLVSREPRAARSRSRRFYFTRSVSRRRVSQLSAIVTGDSVAAKPWHDASTR